MGSLKEIVRRLLPDKLKSSPFHKMGYIHFKNIFIQILLIDYIRFLICYSRYLYFRFIRGKFRSLEKEKEKDRYVAQRESRTTISHNTQFYNFGFTELGKLISSFSVVRSSSFIRPLMGIQRILRNASKTKVLVIGPRSEGELFNLMGHGFKLKNIRGLDLHTYSPHIDLGDIHAMPYGDDSFDLILCGYVIVYSNNQALAAAEIKRVLKDNGIISMAITYSPSGTFFGTGQVNCTDDILNLFYPDVKNVYFKHDQKDEDKTTRGGVITCFSCNKNVSNVEPKRQKGLGQSA